MPTAFYLCPYKTRQRGPRVVRYCAMDDMTPEIASKGGDWSEAQFGNSAIVRVRGTAGVLLSLQRAFPLLGETEALSAPTRKPMRQLVLDVPAHTRSKELEQIIGLWRGIGFGHGWRLAPALYAPFARVGRPPRDLGLEERLRVFGIRGGAFGDTGILDNFNRAAEGPPPSANWATIENGHKVDSTNHVVPVTALQDTNWSRWTAATFGPDSEVFLTAVTLQAGLAEGLGLRIQDVVGVAFDGYSIAEGDDVFEVHRRDNGAATNLGSTISSTFNDGHKLGFDMIGSTITVYKDTGAGWASIGTRSDSTYTAAGNIGLYGETLDQLLDDFGGGTVAAAFDAALSAAMQYPAQKPMLRKTKVVPYGHTGRRQE